ncbi:DoxX family membrane protein [Lacinutrix sp.]|uniref:DoxX family membrane protein n=1 Tax=Lacinutrix sp. TaxID=1937692 RepID=UPI0025BDBFE2|nr:DoxX family membrane protein [Lacinutrix sp.]
MKKEKIIDFGILALRWYLVFYMINYGWGKLTLSQFGVYNPSILEQPIKDIDSFYVAWHLFGRSTFFNVATGILEIIGGILLILNRTVLIGALIVLSILAQILIIDIAFTTSVQGFALPIRIGGMILTDLLILYYYKDKIIIAWKILTNGITTKFKYKWWIFLILPIVGFLMDFIFVILTMPIKLLLNWIAE